MRGSDRMPRTGAVLAVILFVSGMLGATGGARAQSSGYQVVGSPGSFSFGVPAGWTAAQVDNPKGGWTARSDAGSVLAYTIVGPSNASFAGTLLKSTADGILAKALEAPSAAALQPVTAFSVPGAEQGYSFAYSTPGSGGSGQHTYEVVAAGGSTLYFYVLSLKAERDTAEPGWRRGCWGSSRRAARARVHSRPRPRSASSCSRRCLCERAADNW